ncbi:MAG: TetR/AcrR family transcriptional regulator [Mycobacteriaceae bacterium]
MTEERPYGGQLAHERKAARRAALVEAGFNLLGTSGMQAMTVRAVFTHAGLSQRYFYESFATIDDLLVAIFDSVMQKVIDATSNTLPADGNPEGIVRALTHAFVSVLSEPRAQQIALVEAWGCEAMMRRRAETLYNGAASIIATTTAQLTQAPHVGAVEIAAHTIVGGLLQALLAHVDGALPNLSDEEFIDQFTATASVMLKNALAT